MFDIVFLLYPSEVSKSHDMQREREGAGDFFHSGDPFRSFGFTGSMFPSLFSERDPFNDPFFSRPFGSLFESSMFGPPSTSSGTQERPKEKGVLIQELDSDDEGQEDKGHESSEKPSVEHPDDDDIDGNKARIFGLFLLYVHNFLYCY